MAWALAYSSCPIITTRCLVSPPCPPSHALAMSRVRHFHKRRRQACPILCTSSPPPPPPPPPPFSSSPSSPLSSSSSTTKTTTPTNNQDSIRELLQELADSMVLPSDYFATLPNDLQVDIKDAAFALSSGSLGKECGEQIGEVLMRLSQAWEKADTQAATLAVNDLQIMLPMDLDATAATGKRLIRAGKRIASTGQYRQGELQRLAGALIAAGELLSAGSDVEAEQSSFSETRVLKFGDLQVEITSQKAYIGSVIALIFGIVSWELASSLAKISETTLQYTNDNALTVAISLRGTLLALGYSCTLLSAFSMVGLLVLATRLSSQDK